MARRRVPRRRASAGAIPRLVAPLREFLRTETSGGVLLLAAAATALVWVNLPATTYEDLWGRHLGGEIASLHLDLSLRDWINDGLMAVFFFVAGLEIRREVTRGELAGVRRAALPVAAALGGMVAPALIYLAFNGGTEGDRGWGIPMATDIAFAVGVLALLGTRAPLALRVFVLALAIADDIGAIAVIAVFYTDDLSPGWLGAGIVAIAIVPFVGRLGPAMVPLHAVLALAAWLCVHESGVHATVAGVAMGLALPAARLEGVLEPDAIEEALHPWTSYFIVPLFALANAGVELGGEVLRDAAGSRVTLGIVLGLVLGKPLGVTLFTLAAVGARLGTLPAGVTPRHVLGAGIVAGIGFTVSLFIGDLAFDDRALADEARIGILSASLLAGIAGYTLLRLLPGEPGGGEAGE